MALIGNSDLDVFPIGLGGNTFGFTADREATFAILDAWVAGGANFVDTADSYSAWVPGNHGGESETLIGEWLTARGAGAREQLVIATKVSQHPEFKGLAPDNVRAAIDASLQRLQTEVIDLYYAHYDTDPEQDIDEIAAVFGELVTAGKVRQIAVSNFAPERIAAWVESAKRQDVAVPVAVQPYYNLVHRDEVEERIIPVAKQYGLSLVPYFGLEKGFLAGKYRSTELPADASPRAAQAVKFVSPQGLAILDKLDEIAAAHGVAVAAISLAWLRHQPTVVAPLASASRVEQVADLLDAGRVTLSDDEVAALNEVSAWTAPAK